MHAASRHSAGFDNYAEMLAASSAVVTDTLPASVAFTTGMAERLIDRFTLRLDSGLITPDEHAVFVGRVHSATPLIAA
jgi:hypothetical protein